MLPIHASLPIFLSIVVLRDRDRLAFGFGQMSVISLELATTTLSHDADLSFKAFDDKIMDFCGYATGGEIADLTEVISTSIDQIFDGKHVIDKMDPPTATRFHGLFGDLRREIANVDRAGDFMGRLHTTNRVVRMLEARIALLKADGNVEQLEPHRHQDPAGAEVAGEGGTVLKTGTDG